MFFIVAKRGCDRCCTLAARLNERAKTRIVVLGSGCSGNIGLGDVVESAIHTLGLHAIWAWLHGQKATWVCPGCTRRKTWLNKLWYFGDKSTKSLWLALVNSKDLRYDALYPFFVCELDTGIRAFSEISDRQIDNPEVIMALLEAE